MAAFTKENPPADNDFTPAAIQFREDNKPPTPPPAKTEDKPKDEKPEKEQSIDTNHEAHGGFNPLSKAQQEEGKDGKPAPRHYDEDKK